MRGLSAFLRASDEPKIESNPPFDLLIDHLRMADFHPNRARVCASEDVIGTIIVI